MMDRVDELACRAFVRVLNKQGEYGLHPTMEQHRALYDMARVLSKMAYGVAASAYYVSSIDPGVGKTTTIKCWLKEYSECPELYHQVGVLVCVERYEEIRSMVEDLKLSSDLFAILVSDVEDSLCKLGLGKAKVQEAPILFSTKQQVRTRMQGMHKFDSEGVFHYRGRPRRVKIWDESLSVGRPITLGLSELGKLLEPLDKERRLKERVFRLMKGIDGCKNKQLYEVPDLGKYGEWTKLFRYQDQELWNIANDLWLMSNQSVVVRRSLMGPHLVHSVDVLPSDFKPCLISDASARVRSIYDLHERERGDLIRLKTALCSYSNLTCYVLSRRGGRYRYLTDDFYAIADEVAAMVDTRPDEKFLVVHHRTPSRDIRREVVKRMKTDPSRLEFVHWGRHTATNAYSHVPNVILAGTLFYSSHEYEAIGRAASGITGENGEFSPEDEAVVKQGESGHHIYQAGCRGTIRQGRKQRLWIIAAPETGIESMLHEIFPECTVEPWPSCYGLRTLKKAKKAYSYIKQCLKTDKWVVPFREVREAVGVKDWNTFYRDIYSKPEFPRALEELGVFMEGQRNRRRFVYLGYVFIGEEYLVG